MVGSNQAVTHRVGMFVKRMGELGWIEGKSYILEVRSTESNEQLAGVMRNFAQRKVNIIVTAGTPAAVAAKKATGTIPIVDAAMGDPVKTGLVQSLAHPGSNLTGISLAWGEGIPGKLL